MPLDLAEYIAEHGPEKEALEMWIRGKVTAGGSIHDYYPPSPEKAAEYTAETGRSAANQPEERRGFKLKITDVRTAEIKGHGYSTYVRIYTDEGVIGNGECIHGGEAAGDGSRPEAGDHRREPAQRRHALREDAPGQAVRRGDVQRRSRR